MKSLALVFAPLASLCLHSCGHCTTLLKNYRRVKGGTMKFIPSQPDLFFFHAYVLNKDSLS